MIIFNANTKDIHEASLLLKKGALICMPTETIYGLGADATNQEAVQNIFKVKGRPNFNPLIAHVSDLAMAEEIAEFNEFAIKVAMNFWPGPLTLILNKKKNSCLCDAITGGLDTIAVRMPDNELALELISEAGVPIAAPSANKSGRPSPTDPKHIVEQFETGQIAGIIDGGRTKIGLESTILDLTSDTPAILRHGSITREQIEATFPVDIKENTTPDIDGKVRSPGQILKHYAPSLPVRLNVTENVKDTEALIAFGETELTGKSTINLSSTGNLKEAAHNLFAALIELDDETQYNGIAIMPIPNKDIGIAINDKLKRASED